MATQFPNNTETRRVTRRLPTGLPTGIPEDALLVLTLVAATLASMYLPVVSQSVLRFGLAIALFTFLPGYAFIAALFPGRDDVGPIERAVLSVGMSLVISPLIGYGFNLTPFGIRALPVALGLAGFTGLFMFAALARRARKPADQRFSVDLSGTAFKAWDAIWPTNKSGADRTATAMLLASLALVTVMLAALTVVPPSTDRFSELYLYGNNSTIADYPLHFTLGETKPVIVGISNHEGRPVDYVLAVTIGDAEERHEIYRESITLARDQTLEKAINLTPDMTGIRLDMQFLLYADCSTGTPYRACNLWVDVDQPANNTEYERRT